MEALLKTESFYCQEVILKIPVHKNNSNFLYFPHLEYSSSKHQNKNKTVY